MSASLLLLRFAVALAPAAARARLAEEWRADLADCAELGIPAIAVALGAARMAGAARAGRMAASAAAVLRASSPALLGVAIGAICAIGDLPVVAVLLCAAVAPGCVVLVASWRRRRLLLAPVPSRVP